MDRHVSNQRMRFLLQFLFKHFFVLVLGISLFQVLTVISFPIAVAKAGSSLLQAYVAAQNIAILDQNEREQKRQIDSAKKPE